LSNAVNHIESIHVEDSLEVHCAQDRNHIIKEASDSVMGVGT